MNGQNKVCISYAGGRIEDIDSAIMLCDRIELRMDLCTFSDSEYRDMFSKIKYSIAADHSVNNNDNLIKAIDLGAHTIDIDYKNPDFDLIYSKAKAKNKQIIISLHNYENLPKFDELNEFIKICNAKKSDYCKIACKLNTNADMLAIADLYKNPIVANGDIQLLAMGMGKYGPLSRLIALEFGAPFIYCSYLGNLATAEGQLNVIDFMNIYSKLFVEK
jgi:3-dehydroquinate dehydratase type I